MEQSVIYTSEKRNFYLYNDESRLSMLIHPDLYKVYENSTDSGIGDVDPYYRNKYAYLKHHGFFTERDSINLVTEIDEFAVKNSMINTPQIVFEVTEKCNLRCKYCSQGELYEFSSLKTGKDINICSATKLLKYLNVSLIVRKINWG